LPSLVLREEHLAGDVEKLCPAQLGSMSSVWVPNRSSISCDLGIFVDQPTEPVTT
jgi:hypothetical protein